MKLQCIVSLSSVVLIVLCLVMVCSCAYEIKVSGLLVNTSNVWKYSIGSTFVLRSNTWAVDSEQSLTLIHVLLQISRDIGVFA
jgi:hypothetical protein